MQPTHFRFIRFTKIWFSISLIILLAGIGAMIRNKMRNGSFLEYGIDFTGGALMEIKLADGNKEKSQIIGDTINGALPGNVSQITVTDAGTYIIQGKDMTPAEYDKVREGLKAGIGSFEEIRFNTIGPKIGNTLKKKAVVAIGVALVAIVIYLAFAFRKVPRRVSPWRFGLCAVIALAHDVLATVGVFALMRYEVDALFITAILTVIGFSVHDTIVVFDRIRENLKFQGRDQSFEEVADISLNQTLTRSINTSVSTLITLAALYILGAPSIKVFIFALLFGITVGTYSSIFVATPLLVLWQKWGKKQA